MLFKKAVLNLGVLTLAFSATATRSDEPVGFRWDDGEGRSLELLGVCDVKPNSVSCWKSDGVPNKWLEEQMLSLLTNEYTSNQRFAVGKKNRIIVFNDLTDQIGSASFSTEGMKNLYASYGYSQQYGYRPTWVTIAAEPNAKTISISASIMQLRSKPQAIAFSPGKTISTGSKKITYGPIEKIEDQVTTMPASGSRPATTARFAQWRVSATVGSQDKIEMLLGPIALDKFGKRIRYVDEKGNPISPTSIGEEILAGVKEFDSNSISQDISRKRSASMRFETAKVGNKQYIITRVNPIHIAKLELRESGRIDVLFRGIPLDPAAAR